MPTPAQTLQAADGQWHKICLLVMKKLGVDHVTIGPDDIVKMEPGSAIVIQEGVDGDGLLHLTVVDPKTAQTLTSKYAGGVARG